LRQGFNKCLPNKKDKGPQELHRNGNTVGPRIVTTLGCVVDDSGQEKSNGNGELIRANNDTTNPFRCSFGLIHGNYSKLAVNDAILVKSEDILIAEIRPTPKPAKKRPAMKRGWLVDAVWRITPKLKTRPTEAMRPHRRPRKSAKGAAARAPKKVP
jgi:hypothetical protein